MNRKEIEEKVVSLVEKCEIQNYGKSSREGLTKTFTDFIMEREGGLEDKIQCYEDRIQNIGKSAKRIIGLKDEEIKGLKEREKKLVEALEDVLHILFDLDKGISPLDDPHGVMNSVINKTLKSLGYGEQPYGGGGWDKEGSK